MDGEGWRFGPVRVAARPHPPGQRGEPAVRPLLAQWLGRDEVPLVRDAHGRPRLLAPFQDCDASWSHSGGLLLLACARGATVGVDLERLRPRPRALELARRFFAPGEAGRLARLPPAQRERAFVRLWCAKEALLKAHGRGLAFGLHRLELACADDDPAAPLRLLACDPALGAPADWRLHEWTPQPDYVAVLAWRPAGG